MSTQLEKKWQYANANSGGAWSRWHDYAGECVGIPGITPGETNGGYRKWRETPMSNETETPRTDASFEMLLHAINEFAKGHIYAEDLRVQLLQEREHIRAIERDRDGLAARHQASKRAWKNALNGVRYSLREELTAAQSEMAKVEKRATANWQHYQNQIDQTRIISDVASATIVTLKAELAKVANQRDEAIRLWGVEPDEVTRLMEERDSANATISQLRAERKELGEYLWPNQSGLPNEHRNPLVAIKAREKLLRTVADQMAEALRQYQQADHHAERIEYLAAAAHFDEGDRLRESALAAYQATKPQRGDAASGSRDLNGTDSE